MVLLLVFPYSRQFCLVVGGGIAGGIVVGGVSLQ